MKRVGTRASRARVAAGVLWVLLLVGAGQVTAADEAPAPSYPPAGSPVPAAPCAREDVPAWLDFFCRFLTLERWLQAGRPAYIDAAGKSWQPWFYGKEGIANQLLVEDKDYLPQREGWFEALFDAGNFEAQTYSYFWDLFRYAPWGVQLLYAAGCTGAQALNPSALDSTRFRREHVLGFGWQGLPSHAGDPSQMFEPAALPLLLALADVHYAAGSSLRAQLAGAGALRSEINALAEGRGLLWPDYARDGSAWLIRRDGSATEVDDLDAAAARFVSSGLLVTNDAMRSWESGYLAAAEAARTHGPLLYLYFAQDPFLPLDTGRAYSLRLSYLLAKAASLAADSGARLRIVSHGRSAGAVARAVAGHDVIAHHSHAPAVSPLDAHEYAQALRQAMAAGRIDIVSPAFPWSDAREVDKGASASVCVDAAR